MFSKTLPWMFSATYIIFYMIFYERSICISCILSSVISSTCFLCMISPTRYLLYVFSLHTFCELYSFLYAYSRTYLIINSSYILYFSQYPSVYFYPITLLYDFSSMIPLYRSFTYFLRHALPCTTLFSVRFSTCFPYTVNSQ